MSREIISKFNIQKSSLIKILSFCFFAIAILSGGCFYFYRHSKNYKLMLENTYKHSLQDFNNYINSIYSSLDKGLYINTPYQLSNIAANLLSDSRAATMCLSALPAAQLNLENTFKFLAQVGSYASSLNKKYHAQNNSSFSNTANISSDEYKLLKNFKNYAQKLNIYVSDLESRVLKNNINLDNSYLSNHVATGQKFGANTEEVDFSGMEDNFVDYPKVEYDGPFSDHLYNKTPELTKGMKEITVNQARKIAALATGVNEDKLTRSQDENSKLPLYCFKSNDMSIGITQKGGLICYLLRYREIKKAELDPGVAIKTAQKYIQETLKIQNIEQSYYEINNNCCTVNFVCNQDDVVIYPDLIKVSVALDNAQIMSVDARKYINNHRERKLVAPEKKAEEAKKILSSGLTVLKSAQKAIIPSDGEKEVMTYEFVCRTENNETILVYINANTLEEEQILILAESENGILLN